MNLQLLTETEAAKLLRVSRSTVRKLLTPVRLSQNGVRYRASDMEKLIQSKTTK